MKKVYRKSAVHPAQPVVSDQFLLSFLPAAILNLTAALSPEDREVLYYLISCSSSNFPNKHRKTTGKSGSDHPFSCNCFRCYMSYWVKWDSSPNRQLIHEIIDAFEENLVVEGKKKEKNKRERIKGRCVNGIIALGLDESKNSVLSLASENVSHAKSNSVADVPVAVEEGSMSRFVSFVGEKIWSVWG